MAVGVERAEGQAGEGGGLLVRESCGRTVSTTASFLRMATTTADSPMTIAVIGYSVSKAAGVAS